MWVVSLAFGDGGWAEYMAANEEEMLEFLSLNVGDGKPFRIQKLEKSDARP